MTRLVDAVAAKGLAELVLTGGGIGTQILAELGAAPARDAVDWRRVEIWWGDERFLPTGHPERNETGARRALLDHVDLVPERVHPMPGPHGPYGPNPEAAADRYARELQAAAEPQDRAGVPRFDVLMLGIGPPPMRLTLTLPAIRAACEVWIIASGAEKAGAARLALSGAGPVQVPAAGARGVQATLFLLDRAAAVELPVQLGRFASP